MGDKVVFRLIYGNEVLVEQTSGGSEIFSVPMKMAMMGREYGFVPTRFSISRKAQEILFPKIEGGITEFIGIPCGIDSRAEEMKIDLIVSSNGTIQNG